MRIFTRPKKTHEPRTRCIMSLKILLQNLFHPIVEYNHAGDQHYLIWNTTVVQLIFIWILSQALFLIRQQRKVPCQISTTCSISSSLDSNLNSVCDSYPSVGKNLFFFKFEMNLTEILFFFFSMHYRVVPLQGFPCIVLNVLYFNYRVFSAFPCFD